jgi:RNA polymerase sigma-70 factor (ECF subfamily)
MEAEDGALIRESIANPAAFGVLFDRHYKSVYRFLARRLGAPLAGDLAAETFVRAFAGRHLYRPDASPSARPWFFGIATNLLRRHYRAEARQLHAYARSGIDPVLDAAPDVIARADAAAAGPRLAAALAELRPAERDVLLLFAWAELSYAEIGEALGLELGTVRSRLSRARARVRETLVADGKGLAKTSTTAEGNDG